MWRCMDNACRNMCSHHPEDTNRDGTIQFDEFLRYVGKLGRPITCQGLGALHGFPDVSCSEDLQLRPRKSKSSAGMS